MSKIKINNKESDMEDSEVSNDNIARIMEPVTNYTTTMQPVSQNQGPMSINIMGTTTTTNVIARDWDSGVCACFNDCGSCCFAFFCTPCFMCNLFAKAGEPCVSCLCGGLLPLRTKIRTNHGIRGTICDDCCCITCCPLLTAMQMSREIDNTHPVVNF